MRLAALASVFAACSTLTSAFDPRAAAALAAPDPQHSPRTRCTTFLSTVTETRTRGDVDTSTSEILLLQPVTTVVYQTITSTTTFLVTDDRTRTRTRTQTVSECIVGQQALATA